MAVGSIVRAFRLAGLPDEATLHHPPPDVGTHPG